MNVQLLLEELYARPNGRWRLMQALFLVIGMGSLAYVGWIYLNDYVYELDESKAFDRAREQRTPPISRSDHILPQSAQTFRAKLVIARLHIATMVEEGVAEGTLRRAAGHIPGTALPGQLGNVGIAAHRDTLFRKLKSIRAHDRIALSTLTKDYDYEVTATAVVRPKDVSALSPTPGEKTLTLVTCYPFYFIGPAPKRFIVLARQLPEPSASAGED
jgi:sortase A